MNTRLKRMIIADMYYIIVQQAFGYFVVAGFIGFYMITGDNDMRNYMTFTMINMMPFVLLMARAAQNIKYSVGFGVSRLNFFIAGLILKFVIWLVVTAINWNIVLLMAGQSIHMDKMLVLLTSAVWFSASVGSLLGSAIYHFDHWGRKLYLAFMIIAITAGGVVVLLFRKIDFMTFVNQSANIAGIIFATIGIIATIVEWHIVKNISIKD